LHNLPSGKSRLQLMHDAGQSSIAAQGLGDLSTSMQNRTVIATSEPVTDFLE
jgi:hypothetical protein